MQVAVEPMVRAVVTAGLVPWRVGVPDDLLCRMAEASAAATIALGQMRANRALERAGVVRDSRGERCVSVRLQKKRDHQENAWRPAKCGACSV